MDFNLLPTEQNFASQQVTAKVNNDCHQHFNS